MRRSGRRAAGLLFALAAMAGGRSAGAQAAIGQGFELERAGRYADAATVYGAALRGEPANLAALLGLERVLPGLGRLSELLPLVARARAADPRSTGIRALELRTYVALDEPDSAAAVAARWVAADPRSDAPYREWALALADHRFVDEARRVLLAGRRTLGGAATLAVELAELEQRAANWVASAREWGAAVSVAPQQAANAAGQLEDAPDAQHEAMLRALTAPGTTAAGRRLAAELALGWGDPGRAWALLATTLGPPSAEAAAAVRRFADLAGAVDSPEARRARGLALARYADILSEDGGGGPLAARARAEAVRALLDAGDRVAARAVLERLAGDSATAGESQVLAQAALLRVLIEDGQLDAAARQLAAVGARLPGDDRIGLRLALARAWMQRGDLDRADSVLAGDSSVVALAVQGWIALYRGELKTAVELFRAAGPYAGDRGDATDRGTMLALVQQIPRERFPELGAALLTLARGDSVLAVTALKRAADRLDPSGGRPDVLLLAARVAAGVSGATHDSTAVGLFAEVVKSGGDGAAPPAAELAWARLLLRQGRTADAIEHLEHLILTYPQSALIPQARRELERARGAIPKS